MLMHTDLIWVLDVQSYLCNKIKSLPKHSTHDAGFDYKYMKLFDARPNAIHTFGLHIKQFSNCFNIDFSDILETPYFVLPPWCIKPPKIVLDLMHLKKNSTYESIYQQLLLAIMWLVLQFFPSNAIFP